VADTLVAGAVAARVAATAPAYDAEPMQDEAVDAMANANAEGDE
jgi:hypothetical protein